MTGLNVAQPIPVGELDPELVDFARRHVLRWSENTGHFPSVEGQWGPDKTFRRSQEPLHKRLIPLAKAIMDLSEGYNQATQMTLEVDARTTKPGAYLRSATQWHKDYEDRGRQIDRIVVSDNIPTEMLIVRANTRSGVEAMPAEELESLYESRSIPSKRHLRSKGLAIWIPEPYEAVSIAGYLHRSPFNRTENIAKRTFIRAVLETI